jgi:hypothetical protein
VQQVSYGPLIMSIMFIMSCYTVFFNVRRGWQSLNTGSRFYLRLIHRTGWLWISTSRTTDGHPFKPKKLSVPFLYPGVPVGFKIMEGSWAVKFVFKTGKVWLLFVYFSCFFAFFNIKIQFRSQQMHPLFFFFAHMFTWKRSKFNK